MLTSTQKQSKAYAGNATFADVTLVKQRDSLVALEHFGLHFKYTTGRIERG